MSELLKNNRELMMEYDYDKNINIDLDSITCGSGKKIWWVCEKGHEWEAYIYNRSNGQGCPVCNGKKLLVGFNDLQSQYPNISKEWDYEKNNKKPSEVLKGTNKKFWWRCNNNHSYESLIYDRILGKGCPYCSNKKVLVGYNDLATTKPELLKDWDYEKNNLLGIYPTSVTKGTCKKVWWKCHICGNSWFSLIASMTRGFGCPECGKIKGAEKLIKRSIEKNGSLKTAYPKIAKEWDYEKNGKLLPENCSPGSNKRVWWVCKEGHEWKAQINQRCGQKTGCPICAGNTKKTHDEFVKEMKKTNSNIIILNEYINAKSKIKCKCIVCDNIWTAVANNLQQGQGCPNCARIKKAQDQTMSQKEFKKRLKDINPNIKILGEYKNAHKRIMVQCKKCNNIWNPQAWDLIQGNGCPNCSHTSTSYIEKFISESFKYVLGKDKVKERDKKAIKKELDIYIPDYHFAIEPGAWFWHKDKFKNDLEKISLCKEKGIYLQVIYDNYKETNTINNDNILTYTIDLAKDRNFDTLKKLVIRMFEINGINSKISEKKWKEISNKAYLLSRQKNTEDFIKDLNKVNKKVIVIGEYTGYKNKLLVKCKKCSYEWLSDPGHLLNGRGCPKCRGYYKTHEEFEQQVHNKLPNIILISKYIDTKTRMDVKCNNCGNEWNVKPGNLLSGFGCPKCARLNQSKAQCKPVYQYTKDGEFINKYESGKDASNKTGIHRSSIANCCQGVSKTAGGYIWKYSDDN